MLKFFTYVPLLILIILVLPSCAPALQGAEMMPKSSLYDALGNPKNLSRNISLGNVQAEKGAGGAISPVTSENYKEALVLALRQAGWYSPDKARFVLDAHILKIDQPAFGFNFTVKTEAEYTLTEIKTGKVRYHDVLTLPCTVTFGDAFNAEVRLRKATACAVGENITHLLKVLSQRY